MLGANRGAKVRRGPRQLHAVGVRKDRAELARWPPGPLPRLVCVGEVDRRAGVGRGGEAERWRA